jgi:hypothetical protein
MSLHSVFRKTIEQLPPPVAMRLAGMNAYVRKGWVRAQWARRSELYAKLGNPAKVVSGPFEGMSYLCANHFGNFLPNILGVYEKELHPVIEKIIATSPDRVIDVGSAEGYYVIGMARRLPKATVIGFDLLKSARWLLTRSAELNGLQVGGPGSTAQVRQYEGCDPAALEAALKDAQRPFVLCDCEGYEDVLLDQSKVPSLRKATVLVEIHDGNAPKRSQEWVDEFPKGVADRVMERFKDTHEVEVIRDAPRTGADKPRGCALSDAEFVEAVTEKRVIPGLWYVMTPKP